MKTKGVIFIATGSQYRSEAASSLEYSRPFLHSFSTSIYTDDPDDPNISSFDSIFQHPCPSFSYRDKISPLLDLPYDYNLFLDSDSFLVHNPTELFDLLHHFDFLAAQARCLFRAGLERSCAQGKLGRYECSCSLCYRYGQGG